MQEELEEARTLAGANREATVAMARQIEVLIEDQSLKRNDLESLRRQLDASIDSAHDAQSRLRSATERQDSLPPPALLTGTPLTRPTATPMSGVTTQLLPCAFGAMYAGSNERSSRSRRDRDSFDEERPQRSSGSRHSRGYEDYEEDRPRRSSGSRRSRDEDDFDVNKPRRSSGSRRSRERDDFEGDKPH